MRSSIFLCLLTASMASMSSLASANCQALVSDLNSWLTASQRLRVTFTTASKRGEGWTGHATFVGEGSISDRNWDAEQYLSDRKLNIPTSSDNRFQSIIPQPFSYQKTDSLSMRLLTDGRLFVRFNTYNYEVVLNTTCSNGFLYAEQGLETHVLTFYKYNYNKPR